MTPKQKELLVRALLAENVWLNGGEYNTLKALHSKGWTTDRYVIGRKIVTPEGLQALEDNSQPIEIFRVPHQYLILIKGQPVAEVLPGQLTQVENLLANSSL